MGAVFHCFDPVLTIVSGLSVRDPFLLPQDKKDVSTKFSKQSVSASKLILGSADMLCTSDTVNLFLCTSHSISLVSCTSGVINLILCAFDATKWTCQLQVKKTNCVGILTFIRKHILSTRKICPYVCFSHHTKISLKPIELG